MPTEQQWQQILADEIDEEILYREALTRQWHLTDSVVRQRLIRNMRFLNPKTQDDEALIDAADNGGKPQLNTIARKETP